MRSGLQRHVDQMARQRSTTRPPPRLMLWPFAFCIPGLDLRWDLDSSLRQVFSCGLRLIQKSLAPLPLAMAPRLSVARWSCVRQFQASKRPDDQIQRQHSPMGPPCTLFHAARSRSVSNPTLGRPSFVGCCLRLWPCSKITGTIATPLLVARWACLRLFEAR